MEVIAELIAHAVIWIAQFLGELLLQAFGELIAELLGRSVIEPFKRAEPIRPWLAAIGYCVFGAIAGAISLWLLPALFISALWLRLVNLIATPIVSGLMMERLGAWREKREQTTIRLDSFAYGFIFSLSMALVRFTWGH